MSFISEISLWFFFKPAFYLLSNCSIFSGSWNVFDHLFCLLFLMHAKDCSLYVLSVFTLSSSSAGIVLLMPWVGSTCLSRGFEHVFANGLKTSKMHF